MPVVMFLVLIEFVLDISGIPCFLYLYWKLIHGRLPTWDYLVRKVVTSPFVCCLCCADDDFIMYIFFIVSL